MDIKEQYRLYLERWEVAGPMMEEVRRRELQEMDAEKVIADLGPVIDWALANFPPRETSGLAEQQKIFMEYARRNGLLPEQGESEGEGE